MGTHPGIAEIAIIGIPDAKWGEVGAAFIVPRDPSSLTTQAVLDYCDGRLAHFKIPKQIIFVDVLPRNAMGKVVKNELRVHLALADNTSGDYYA